MPICVDLDGTLILSDLLFESLILLIKRNPFYLFCLPFWFFKGKATFKAKIAQLIKLNPVTLPYNHDFLNWLLEQKNLGRELWLCTASNYRLAYSIAEHLQIFSGVLASSDEINLSGKTKAEQLVKKFSEKEFDYCGNHSNDLEVWKVSNGIIVVNGCKNLTKSINKISNSYTVFPKKHYWLKPLVMAFRPYHWVKNLLLFVPLMAAHKLNDIVSIENTVIAFFIFCLCASSVYILNDMIDIEVDRQHKIKHKRPFASGELSILIGVIAAPILLLVATFFATKLPVKFGLVLSVYFALTVIYSLVLKKIVMVDIIVLAGLYTVRIIAGSMAIDVQISFWLLLFSIFLFFSLALVKRYTELDAMQREGRLGSTGRGYNVEDLPILHNLGTTSGYLSVLVLALYINSPVIESLYHHPQAIWFLCVLLLYWMSFIWLKTHQGKMHDDPVIFAVTDKTSLVVIMLSAITVLAAI
jgi:4-hydroxybenzoate polyprenyltransferase